MSLDNLGEAAINGDLSAISSLIQQAFTPQEICIDAEIQRVQREKVGSGRVA